MHVKALEAQFTCEAHHEGLQNQQPPWQAHLGSCRGVFRPLHFGEARVSSGLVPPEIWGEKTQVCEVATEKTQLWAETVRALALFALW